MKIMRSDARTNVVLAVFLMVCISMVRAYEDEDYGSGSGYDYSSYSNSGYFDKQKKKSQGNDSDHEASYLYDTIGLDERDYATKVVIIPNKKRR